MARFAIDLFSLLLYNTVDMKKTNNHNIYAFSVRLLAVFAVVFAVTFIALPHSANASFNPLNPIDPFGLFSGNNNDSKKTVNNYTNSNVNSPGATLNVNDNRVTVNGNTNSDVAVNNPTGTHYYEDDYRSDRYPTLSVTCSVSDTRISEGDSVTWRAYVSGGTGSYRYDWEGTDGLGGSSQTVRKTYYGEGTKFGTITVHSGAQNVTRACENVVRVDYDDDYYDDNYDDDNYDDDYYNDSLSVSCSPDVNSANIGDYITWRAYVSGGNGSYRYTWSGSEGLDSSNSRTVSKRYSNTGTKTAKVTVRSGSRSITRTCDDVRIYDNGNYRYPSSYNPIRLGALEVSCYPSVNTAAVGQKVSWGVAATGGAGNYVYSWSGTDNISGILESTYPTYWSTGVKTASVTVRSGSEIVTRACTGGINVVPAAVSRTTTNTTVVKNTTDNTKTNVSDNNENGNLSAASLFAIDHIPWGWVLLLVIFALMVVVAYLVAQKNKK